MTAALAVGVSGAALVASLQDVRLLGVSASIAPSTVTVLVTSSAPAPYTILRPDPLTVLVDLRDVSPAGAVVRLEPPVDPIASITVEPAESLGGQVARIRIALTAPVSHRARSSRANLLVEFDKQLPRVTADNVLRAEGTGGLIDRVRARSAPSESRAIAPPIDPPAAVDPIEALRSMPAPSPAMPPTPGALAAAAMLSGAARPGGPQPVPQPVPPVEPPHPSPGPPAGAGAGASPPPADVQSAAPPQQVPLAPAPAPRQVPPPPVPVQPGASTPIGSPQGEKVYIGHPVTLDFQNVDLRSVLRVFVDISGLNIVIDPAVQGTVDIVLRDVPWDQALDIILRTNKLGYTVDGTVVRIAPLSVLAEEEAQRRKLAEEQALSGDLHVQTRTLSYARAAQLAQLITRTALSPRGQIQVDERTNTLIITDLPDRLDTAAKLIDTLDRPEPQVEVEARIVQTTREFARSVGVQWGLTGRVSQELGNTTPLVFPNRGSLGGRTGVDQGPQDPRALPSEQSGTAVNLPATNATSAIGLALGAVNGSFNLDVALSALERTGKGRVLSSPRLSTQNNVTAEVTQGIQIPIQTVANNTVVVSFKDAALTLKVTPQITSANTVIMQITLENASPDFSREVNGIPPIDTQRANTQVQVNDGATTVIGGIFVSREQSSTDRTPVLHRIPLLGWLFKRDSIQDESRELLIFISPRIIRN
jgi:type IV pilus assembly protein PilQ